MPDEESQTTTHDYIAPSAGAKNIPPPEEPEPPEDYDPPQVPRKVDYAAATVEIDPLSAQAEADKRYELRRAGLLDPDPGEDERVLEARLAKARRA